MGKTIILRVQAASGTKRLEIDQGASLRDLFEGVHSLFELDSFDFALFKERNNKDELTSSRSQHLADVSLKHGDMVYLKQLDAPVASTSSATAAPPLQTKPSSSSLSTVSSSSSINSMAGAGAGGASASNANINKKIYDFNEDDVDQALSKTEGRIQRKRDPKLCRHNSNGCCVHCSPIEPWDEAYMKEQKLKHLSFHAYIRKLTSGVDRGKFVALEDINCRIKGGCREHLPWPKGICSKCQPSALTLNRQAYRHVDNVMFENTALVERFLDYWRYSGHQRMGLLYGTYEVSPDVPLGIRARVAAIYEPPQESSKDSIKLLDDDHGAEVDEIAQAMGLRKVGWIFTDLVSEDMAAGTVKHLRGIKTHFLTAQECILAAHLQNKNPNPCKYASKGSFGSKFVTVCVTGDDKNQIHMEGYAVSAQCMALVRDDCLVPTKDAPELGYIRESTDKQYVPDVYYKEKDQYGNEVQRLSRPLPVEYLLVDVPATTPLTPTYTFTVREDRRRFPVENRPLDGHLQDFHALSTYLSQWQQHEFVEAISDFHLLVYLARMDVMPIKETMPELLEALRVKNADAVNGWRTQEVWRTLETVIAASSSGSSMDDFRAMSGGMGADGMGGGAGSGMDIAGNNGAAWPCTHCTFINAGDMQNCDMCSLPRA